MDASDNRWLELFSSSPIESNIGNSRRSKRGIEDKYIHKTYIHKILIPKEDSGSWRRLPNTPTIHERDTRHMIK